MVTSAMKLMPSGTAPGGNIASAGMAIWIAGSGWYTSSHLDIASWGATACRRWIFRISVTEQAAVSTTAGAGAATAPEGGRRDRSTCARGTGQEQHGSNGHCAGQHQRPARQADGATVDAIVASQYALNARVTCLYASRLLRHSSQAPGRAAAHRRLRRPGAHGRAKQSIFRKSHTLHFSANFLMARSTVSPTVEVGIPKTSPISR